MRVAAVLGLEVLELALLYPFPLELITQLRLVLAAMVELVLAAMVGQKVVIRFFQQSLLPAVD